MDGDEMMLDTEFQYQRVIVQKFFVAICLAVTAGVVASACMSKIGWRRAMEIFPMSRSGMVWQSESHYEVLSLMFKAYILSMVLVVFVLVWSASDAWTQYAEFCYMTGSFIRLRRDPIEIQNSATWKCAWRVAISTRSAEVSSGAGARWHSSVFSGIGSALQLQEIKFLFFSFHVICNWEQKAD